jgi:hypothetical protein
LTSARGEGLIFFSGCACSSLDFVMLENDRLLDDILLKEKERQHEYITMTTNERGKEREEQKRTGHGS